MSHLVNITLFGEMDGVTLSRLGCIYNIHSMPTPGLSLPTSMTVSHWIDKAFIS